MKTVSLSTFSFQVKDKYFFELELAWLGQKSKTVAFLLHRETKLSFLINFVFIAHLLHVCDMIFVVIGGNVLVFKLLGEPRDIHGFFSNLR